MTTCDLCAATFPDLEELLVHLGEAHPDPEQTAGPDDPEAWAEAQAAHPDDDRGATRHYSNALGIYDGPIDPDAHLRPAPICGCEKPADRIAAGTWILADAADLLANGGSLQDLL